MLLTPYNHVSQKHPPAGIIWKHTVASCNARTVTHSKSPKRYTCSNPPPPQKKTHQTKNKINSKQTHSTFCFCSVPGSLSTRRRWLFSGRLDWWTRNHRHLNDWRPTELLPSTRGGAAGEDGLGWGDWVGLGRIRLVVKIGLGWVGLWVVGCWWLVGSGCLQAIQVLQWFFYPKHSWGFQPWLRSWQTPKKITSQLRRPVGFASWRPWWRPKSLNNRPAPDTPKWRGVIFSLEIRCKWILKCSIVVNK